jgi:hypothetical protein
MFGKKTGYDDMVWIGKGFGNKKKNTNQKQENKTNTHNTIV